MKFFYIFMSLVCAGQSRSGVSNAKLSGYPRTACPPSESIPQPTLRVDASDLLSRFRQEMTRNTVRAEKFDAYLLPGTDAHQSQSLAERDKRIKFLTGFTGGRAMAIITQEKAAIWVDPFEAKQADEEISCNWTIYTNSKNDISIPQWVQMNLRARSRIGVDASLISQSQWEILSRRMTLVTVRNNLVDLVWAGRPQYRDYNVVLSPYEQKGDSWLSKVTRVREALRNESCDTIIVTALDEISWVLNIRGRETEYLPVVRAYLVITDKEIRLYTNVSRLSYNVKGMLNTDGCVNAECVKLMSYESVWGDMRTMTAQTVWKKVLFPGEAPLIPGGSRAIHEVIVTEKVIRVSPVALMKAVKSANERAGMDETHLKDAVAFCDFMAYFENKMKAGDEWDEFSVAATLDEFRRQQVNNDGISFKTVVAFGAHSASPHHDTNNITSIKINSSSVLLIDSGGQYLDGTTELTRTFHLGKPSDEQIQVYTRALMGLIDFASGSFPDTITLQEADVLARAPLWGAGLNYDHSTGHGIGVLSVEEGPLMISQEEHPKQRFKEGNYITAGPGYYEEGQYGIRIKNVLEVTSHFKNESRMTQFRSVTLVPFEPKLIDRKLLSPKQITWLNDYNTRIREEVGAELKRQTKMKGFYWMMEKAQVIPVARSSASYTRESHVLFLVASVAVYYVLSVEN